MAKVSIIAGAYNIEKCFSFHKSMESILLQTFSDFEFIICDDGSSDNTYNLLKEYEEKDKRVKLIQNPKNMGLAFSLNKCLEVASGEFIARHDLDDYSHVGRLEKQVSFLKEHEDVSVLGTNSLLFDEGGVWGKQDFPEEVTNKDFLFTSPYKHGSVMMRRSVLDKVNGYRVSKETRRAEDYDLFMSLQTFCKGANLQEYLYYFCESEATRKRRKYRYRVDEMKVRFIGYKKLKLYPKGFFYAVKPLIVGLIPQRLLTKMQNKFFKREIQEVEDDKAE